MGYSKSALLLAAMATVALADVSHLAPAGKNAYLPPKDEGYHYPPPEIPFEPPVVETRPPPPVVVTRPPPPPPVVVTRPPPPPPVVVTRPPPPPPVVVTRPPPPPPEIVTRPPYLPPTQPPLIDQPTNHHEHHEHGMPYQFRYAVKDDDFNNDFNQNEESNGEVINGEYRVLLPDGRTQVVQYTADWKNGYTARVSYEGEARLTRK